MADAEFCFRKIGVACDHAGRELKAMLVKALKSSGLEIVDYGTADDSTERVDYPDYVSKLAVGVSSKQVDAGIAICGTGFGMAITANKYPHVRAVCVWDEFTCRMSRQHNDANVLCLGGRTLNYFRALDLAQLWLKTSFLGEQHAVRLEKIDKIEKKLLNPNRKN